MRTNCPNCGAPVDLHAEKCAYCDTPYLRAPCITQTADTITIDFDVIQLSAAAAKAFQSGLITPNEARRLVGLAEVLA